MRFEREVKSDKATIRIKKDMFDRLNLNTVEFQGLPNALITLHKLGENYIFNTDDKNLFDMINSSNKEEFLLDGRLVYKMLNDDNMDKKFMYVSGNYVPECLTELLLKGLDEFVKVQFSVEYVARKN